MSSRSVTAECEFTRSFVIAFMCRIVIVYFRQGSILKWRLKYGVYSHNGIGADIIHLVYPFFQWKNFLHDLQMSLKSVNS